MARIDWVHNVITALFELVRARIDLKHCNPNIAIGERELLDLTPPIGREVEKVAYFIPRVAARLPWRSDCLVQALAARRWLRRLGIASTLHVGVKREEGEFMSHAWLSCGDVIVTGGDIAGYTPLARPS